MENPISVLKSSHLTIPHPKKNSHPPNDRSRNCVLHLKGQTDKTSYRSQTFKQKTRLEHVLFEDYSELIILLSSQPANLRN